VVRPALDGGDRITEERAWCVPLLTAGIGLQKGSLPAWAETAERGFGPRKRIEPGAGTARAMMEIALMLISTIGTKLFPVGEIAFVRLEVEDKKQTRRGGQRRDDPENYQARR
jgi:hypothetical protein